LPSKEYYLVFYHDIRAILNKFIQMNEDVEYIQYTHFEEIKEIESSACTTVYTAKYTFLQNRQESVVLKHFKSSDETVELFINEVSNF